MKLIKRGDDRREEFVNTQHRCVKCSSAFEVETVDDVQDVHVNALGMSCWATVECPGCKRVITITTIPRLICDTDTAEPLFNAKLIAEDIAQQRRADLDAVLNEAADA